MVAFDSIGWLMIMGTSIVGFEECEVYDGRIEKPRQL